jgi:hypothetical protein
VALSKIVSGGQTGVDRIPFGLLVTWWYARTGKLWPILVAHAVIDLMSLLQFVN